MEIKLNSSKLKFRVDKKNILKNLLDFNVGSAITEIISVDESQEASAFSLLFNVAKKLTLNFQRNWVKKKLIA